MDRNFTAPALVLAILASTLGVTAQSWAARFQSLYSFRPAPDANNPIGGIAIDPNGVIYGTSFSGGSNGSGTVFTLMPPTSSGGKWTEAIIWDFPRATAGPGTGLVRDVSGNLFGTTGIIGGGSIYELSPLSGGGWNFSDLWTFGESGPTAVQSDLTLVNGSLYGAAFQLGGPPLPDGVFGLAPGGSLRPLYAFKDSPDGEFPSSSLTQAASGNSLFGVTLFGGNAEGSSGCGIVYELTSSGGQVVENILYTFQGSVISDPDGCEPAGPLLNGINGVLYGTTEQGGSSGNGTIYSLTPPAASGGAWTETILYSFAGGSDGSGPFGPLVSGPNGILYGTTQGGHTAANGTIFSLTPPTSSGGAWTETVLYAFSGPYVGPNELTLHNGVLYGTTYQGGFASVGTVFALLP